MWDLWQLWDKNWLSILLITLFIAFLHNLIQKWRTANQREAQLRGNLKSVPMVKGNGWIPLIGHGLSYAWDMNGFLRRCEQKYGKIFKIQFFTSNFIIMTDREFVTEFMAAKEEEMSFFTIFDRMYFFDAYGCSKLSFQEMVRVVIRNGVAANWNGIKEMQSKVENQARELAKRLMPIPEKMVDFREEMRYFVANSNARIFLGEPLSKKCFSDLAEFFKLFNNVIMLSFFLPKTLIRFFLHKRLCYWRDVAGAGFFLLIQKYREDPNLNESYILRTLVDYTEEGSGETLSDTEIGRILVVFLHIATENTVIGFNSVLADLFLHPEIWTKCKSEVEQFVGLNSDGDDLRNMDFEGLLASEYLHAVILESARLNPEEIQISRKPGSGTSINGYYVGDANTIALATGLLHVSGNSARKLFTNPENFNPPRFLRSKEGNKSKMGEPSGPTAIITWGAGNHYCPGKSLALAEIKVALTVVLLALQKDNVKLQIKKGLVSPGFFTDRSVKAVFK